MRCNRTYTSFNNYIARKSGIGACCLEGPTGPASTVAGVTGPTGSGDVGADGPTGAKGPTGPGGGASDASMNQIFADISGLDASMNQAFIDISANTACCERLDASMVQIFDLVDSSNSLVNYYFFDPPRCPTDGSGTLLTGGTPVIRFTWTNPIQYRAAFNFAGPVPDTTSGTSIADDAYNYLPYFKGTKIEYRLYTPGGPNPAVWNDVPQSVIATPWNTDFLPREVVQADIDGAAGSFPDGNLNPPSNTIYSGSIVGTGESIQLRVAMTNGAQVSIPDVSGGGADASWCWLYIPDGSGANIPLGNYGPAPPPLTLNIPSGAGIGYKTFTLAGACDNPNGTAFAAVADTSLNTPLPIPGSIPLRVQYQVDMSGARSVSSIQVGGNTAIIDISYAVPAGANPTGASNPWSTPLLNGDPVYPQHDYQIYAYYMRNSSDLSMNMATTLPMPSSSWTTKIPDRTDVTTTYTSFLSPSTLGGITFTDTSGTSLLGAANRGDTGVQINSIHFLDPVDVTRWTSSDVDPLAANAANNRGTDTIGQSVMYIEANMINNTSYDISSNIFNGWTADPASVAQDVSNNHIRFTGSALVDARNVGAAVYEGGYYLGNFLANIEVNNIDLAAFPDISNNTPAYSSYELKVYQYVWDLAGPNFFQNGALASSFNIGAEPQNDILNTYYLVTTTPSSVVVGNPANTADFFGIKNLASANSIISYDLSLNDIYTTWGPTDDDNLTNVRIMFSPNGVNNEWTQSINAWSYPLTSTRKITDVLSLPPAKYSPVAADYPYARAHDHWQTAADPQFRVEGTFDNNIHRSNRTTAGNPFGTGTSFTNTDISFNNEAIWWDKTYNFTPAINAFYNSGDGEYPTNYTSGTSPFYGTLYSNVNIILDNQLMWANTGGFTSGNYTTTATDNPYINYNIFYQQTRDYSGKNTTGDAKSLTYSAANDDYYQGGNKTITGDYKWLMVRDVKSTAGDFGRIVITGTGGALTLGDDFLLYVQEIDSYFDPANNTTPAGYAVGRSGWKAVQGTWDQGATVQLNNANEAGCYRRNTNTGAVAVNFIKLYSPNANVPIFYRIGLKNSSNIKMSSISITYGTN